MVNYFGNALAEIAGRRGLAVQDIPALTRVDGPTLQRAITTTDPYEPCDRDLIPDLSNSLDLSDAEVATLVKAYSLMEPSLESILSASKEDDDPIAV